MDLGKPQSPALLGIMEVRNREREKETSRERKGSKGCWEGREERARERDTRGLKTERQNRVQLSSFCKPPILFQPGAREYESLCRRAELLWT